MQRPEATASKAKFGSFRFATRDQNNDGSIDHTEFVATATTKNKDAIETRFQKMDANSDGRITREEFDKMTAAE